MIKKCFSFLVFAAIVFSGSVFFNSCSNDKDDDDTTTTSGLTSGALSNRTITVTSIENMDDFVDAEVETIVGVIGYFDEDEDYWAYEALASDRKSVV